MAKKPRTRVITDFNDDSEDISKTERKQMAADLRDFAKVLTELPKTKLQQMELPQVFLDAIAESNIITSHIAKKRHFQFMGKLLIKLDHVAIQEKLNQLENLDGHYQIRDEIINLWIEHLTEHEKVLFEYLYENHDHEAIALLRQTFRNHKKKPDSAAGRKKLFQALRSFDKKAELLNPMALINS